MARSYHPERGAGARYLNEDPDAEETDRRGPSQANRWRWIALAAQARAFAVEFALTLDLVTAERLSPGIEARPP